MIFLNQVKLLGLKKYYLIQKNTVFVFDCELQCPQPVLDERRFKPMRYHIRMLVCFSHASLMLEDIFCRAVDVGILNTDHCPVAAQLLPCVPLQRIPQRSTAPITRPMQSQYPSLPLRPYLYFGDRALMSAIAIRKLLIVMLSSLFFPVC